jgi:hypothetical protein
MERLKLENLFKNDFIFALFTFWELPPIGFCLHYIKMQKINDYFKWLVSYKTDFD